MTSTAPNRKNVVLQQTGQDAAGNESPIVFGLYGSRWGQDETIWLNLFAGAFLRTDPIVLSIYIDKDPTDRQRITARIEGIMEKYQDPMAVEIHEGITLPDAPCHYWLATPHLKSHQSEFPEASRFIEKPELSVLLEIFFSHFPSSNAYEYEFLVDAYDFEKTGSGVKETAAGTVPCRFGSTAGPIYQHLLTILNDRLHQDAAILEVGCGAGAFYKTLKINGMHNHYTGIDYSRSQIARSLRNYPEGNFQVGNVCGLNFSDSMYDAVFENNVLIFTTDPLTAVSEMCRVSRGYVFFTVHLVKSPQGLYCCYPFSTIHDLDPQTNRIKIQKDQERFFGNGNIKHRRIGENKIQAFMAKVPIYIPGIDEFRASFAHTLDRYAASIEEEEINDIKKEIWINPEMLNRGIVSEDCVVTESDRFMEIDSVRAAYLLRVRQ